MLLVVLQNAYRYSGKNYRKRQWLLLLWRSHTGRRLREMLPENCKFEVINASPQIGITSKSVFDPDLKHIKAEIDRVGPDIILACGKVAQAGLGELGIVYIGVPHPAWRALTKVYTTKIKKELEARLKK